MCNYLLGAGGGTSNHPPINNSQIFSLHIYKASLPLCFRNKVFFSFGVILFLLIDFHLMFTDFQNFQRKARLETIFMDLILNDTFEAQTAILSVIKNYEQLLL